MIEEKALAVNWCNEFFKSQDDYTLTPIGYQYILWNRSKEYQTQSFDWLILNAHLRASLDNHSFTEQFFEVIQSVETYSDILKLIKIENELRDFQQFTNIVPFKKLIVTRG
ncbi:hypothetical protein [Alkalihalobacillus sp. BA299]|uniref:hypothetical protein n=1 Tax=Alkalihalobacillus sp. BA299 TaxID=2815938 RepID=UPI001ADABF24|nr:hypothetical protein [Alkalihalobacillus sp. BA299]